MIRLIGFEISPIVNIKVGVYVACRTIEKASRRKILGGWSISGIGLWHTGHPLTEQVFKRKKHSQLVAQVLVAFERVNTERDPDKRRKLFYQLIQDIFAKD